MQFFDRYFWTVFSLALAIGAGVVAWVDWRCSVGADCRPALVRDLSDWQALITGVFVLAGAVLVLLSSRWKIEAERDLAARSDVERIRAARMRIAYQLELFADTYRGVLREIEAPGLPLTPTRMLLPQPPFDFWDLAAIPPSESEALLRFAHGIAATNERLFRTWHARQLATQIARLRAVRTLLESIEWRNRYAPLIGWSEVRLMDAERVRLQELAENPEER
jgi:hypothetical protein